MTRGLSRRQFLKVTASGTVLLVTGLSMEGCEEEAPKPRFFSARERDMLEAAAARIIPSDQDAGAREASVVGYIESLLTAFDHEPPRIFAGGPFSGRQPHPDNRTGRPSKDFPPNSFERFLPLSRVKELAWRVRLFGSRDVPGGDFNDAALGPTTGWREAYRRGVDALDAKSRELFGKSFVALAPEEQDQVLAQADAEFVRLLVEHTVEGMYSTPEYGGNRDLVGWRSVRFEGDSQPLGYSIFDESTGVYKEMTDRPLSTPNPDEDFRPLDGDVAEFINAIATGTGGKRFF